MAVEFVCSPMKKGPNKPAANVVIGRRVNSWFGSRPDPFSGRISNHGGEDLQAWRREELFSVWQGHLLQFWDYGGGGYWSALMHASGARVGYGHMDEFFPGLTGRVIPANIVIGWADSTGSSTGDHLHLAYDSEDGNTYYDDPHPRLEYVDRLNLYPDGSGLIIPPFPQEDLPMPEFKELIAKFDEVLALQHRTLAAVAPIEFLDDWENHTRIIVIDGVERRVADRIANAGWASRPYLCCPERLARPKSQGGPERLYFYENGRMVEIDPQLSEDMIRIRLNPDVQIMQNDRFDRLVSRFPIQTAA